MRFGARKFWAAAVALVGLAGCAHLDYVKVPSPTQYSSWSDADQRKADKMKGVRYYLPRPFLQLKQSTPVAQRVAFVSFRLDTTANAYILELPENPPTWLTRAAPKRLSITQAMAASLASPAAVNGAGGKGTVRQEAGSTGGDGGAAATTATSEPAKPAAPTTPSELHSHTGFINDTDPVTRLGDRMDVVYLPDFDEQFVIQPHAMLGAADVEVRLRNGWAAEVFSNQVDNSKLIPYVIDQVSHASDAAANILTTWAPLIGGLPPLNLKNILKQEAGSTGATVDATQAHGILGDLLLFKVTEIKIAQPGLYPILKPREIRDWFRQTAVVSADDPEATFELFLKQANLPWIRPDMAFIPCPPFTMIAFNATTDIFISPATEKSVIGDGGNPSTVPGIVPSPPGQITKIINALKDKKDSITPATLVAKIKFDNISVDGGSTGGTDITINSFATATASFDENDRKVQNFQPWIHAAFPKLTDEQVKKLALDAASDSRTIHLSIGVPVSEMSTSINPPSP